MHQQLFLQKAVDKDDMNNTQVEQKGTEDHIRRAIFDDIDMLEELVQAEGQEGGKSLQWYDTADAIKVLREDCHQAWQHQHVQIAVLALVKSGKSTFINSWLGNEFLPISSQPETARIVRIKHQPQNTSGTLHDGTTVIHGAQAICDHLRGRNAQVRIEEKTSIAQEIKLDAPFVFLQDHPLGEIQFEILDTPGPNEAGAKQLWLSTIPFVQRADLIFYLLDATKLKTTGEQQLLTDIAAMRQDLLTNQKIYFILNKIDLMNRTSLNYPDMAGYVATLLRQQIQHLHITADQILFVSAEEALLARLVQHSYVPTAVLEDFTRRVFGETELSSISEEKYHKAALRLLKRSHMSDLEETILANIYAQQEHLLLGEMLNRFKSLIDQFYTYISAIYERLESRQINLNERVQQLELELATIFSHDNHTSTTSQSFKHSLVLKKLKEAQGGESNRIRRLKNLQERLARLTELRNSLVLPLSQQKL